eukprot:INCI5370.1.p1 GENE.INCI5370.1~~INCI5370.1.p1  ORF type:complete len:1421 (-),score=221.58 INCI5370.1:353-4615(-)
MDLVESLSGEGEDRMTIELVADYVSDSDTDTNAEQSDVLAGSSIGDASDAVEQPLPLARSASSSPTSHATRLSPRGAAASSLSAEATSVSSAAADGRKDRASKPKKSKRRVQRRPTINTQDSKAHFSTYASGLRENTPERNTISPTISPPAAQAPALDVLQTDVKQQWEQTVEKMASGGPCADPLCQDCRWPRSQSPSINCVTARAECKTIAAKFDEHVQVVYYIHALQHISAITVGAYALLAAVLLMYLVGANRLEFVNTEERDFSVYPAIALVVYSVCIATNALLLVFLWGVQGGCWLKLGEAQIAAVRSKEFQHQQHKQGALAMNGVRKPARFSNLGRRPAKSKLEQMRDNLVSFHSRAYATTRRHMQLFQLMCLLPIMVCTSSCIFFLYVGKFQAQREFLKMYFNNQEEAVVNTTAWMVGEFAECNQTQAEQAWISLPESGGLNLPPNNDELASNLWDAYIGVGSPRNLTKIPDVVLEIAENHVEVATFIFLVGAKLLVLFLMVVHHSGFWYLLAAAFLDDICVLVAGFTSISSGYARELAENSYFWVWLLLYVASSFPMVVSFGFLQRRAVQLFLIMLSTAEDNLRASRPNIVHQCLYVDQTANGKIGAGGSGQVYKGRYAGFEVAVKELFTASLDHRNRRESFKEAEVLSRVRHPNIVTFYGLNITAARFQLCTELCAEGLDRVLDDRHVELGPARIAIIALQIAYGLQYLHSMQLEHKDIKPANILFKEKIGQKTKVTDIHVKIADFGLAKFTPKGVVDEAGIRDPSIQVTGGGSSTVGTIEYMPPEALRLEESRYIEQKLRTYRSGLSTSAKRRLDAALNRNVSSNSLVNRSASLEAMSFRKSVRKSSSGRLERKLGLGRKGSSPSYRTLAQLGVTAGSFRVGAASSKGPIGGGANAESEELPPSLPGVVPFAWDTYSLGALLWELHSRKPPFAYVRSVAYLEIMRQEGSSMQQQAAMRTSLSEGSLHAAALRKTLEHRSEADGGPSRLKTIPAMGKKNDALEVIAESKNSESPASSVSSSISMGSTTAPRSSRSGSFSTAPEEVQGLWNECDTARAEFRRRVAAQIDTNFIDCAGSFSENDEPSDADAMEMLGTFDGSLPPSLRRQGSLRQLCAAPTAFGADQSISAPSLQPIRSTSTVRSTTSSTSRGSSASTTGSNTPIRPSSRESSPRASSGPHTRVRMNTPVASIPDPEMERWIRRLLALNPVARPRAGDLCPFLQQRLRQLSEQYMTQRRSKAMGIGARTTSAGSMSSAANSRNVSVSSDTSQMHWQVASGASPPKSPNARALDIARHIVIPVQENAPLSSDAASSADSDDASTPIMNVLGVSEAQDAHARQCSASDVQQSEDCIEPRANRIHECSSDAGRESDPTPSLIADNQEQMDNIAVSANENEGGALQQQPQLQLQGSTRR